MSVPAAKTPVIRASGRAVTFFTGKYSWACISINDTSIIEYREAATE